MGFFAKIKEKLKKTKETIAYKLNKLFTGGVLTDDFYDELEMALISSDIGAETVEKLMDDLRDVIDEKRIRNTAEVKDELKSLMVDILDENPVPEYEYPLVLLVAGVNGVGKTTAARIIAASAGKKLERLNGTTASTGDIKAIIAGREGFDALPPTNSRFGRKGRACA